MESRVTERRIAADLGELSREAGKEICILLSEAIRRDGRASLVLCGGKTPVSVYRLLASEFKKKISWEHVDFFWGDERYVDPSHEQSNFRLANERLLAPLGISSRQIHPMPTMFENPVDAAASYERLLREHFKSPVPSFDVLLLGMGADGHVASIFPGNSAPLAGTHLVEVTSAPLPPTTRLTMTFLAINAAESVLILVAGKEKRDVLERIQRTGDRTTYPVSSVTGKKRLIWFLDREAAGIPS